MEQETTTTTTREVKKKKNSKKESSSTLKNHNDDDHNKTTIDNNNGDGKTYEERIKAVNIICHPLASKKSTKKAHKLVKKAAQAKNIRRGVKEVVKGLRKGEQGLAILAGDIYPLDVYSFLPILLEEKKVPYLFVPSKQDLGAAACTKRPTSVVLIKNFSTSKKSTSSEGKSKNDSDGKDLMDALITEANEYDPLGV
jgi:H/ACA ribonucleoprotein complex subunit 2